MTDQTTGMIELVKTALVLANTALVGFLAFRQSKLASNVQKIELATNSMKDALVQSTATASHLEGVASEKARAKEEAASNAAAIKKESEP